MPRVKRSTKRADRRRKILKRASGYFLTKSKLYQAAQEAVERGLKFAYTGRKQKKRQYRSLWIVRIGAAALQNAGSQDSGRHCSQRRSRFCGARGGREGCPAEGGRGSRRTPESRRLSDAITIYS